MNIRMDRAILITVIAGLLLLIALTAIEVNAQDIVCQPFVYETIQGLVPIGTPVTFDDYNKGQRVGVIVAYYWLPCWPGVPVLGLDDVAYVIDHGEFGPAGHPIQAILNREQFEAVEGVMP